MTRVLLTTVTTIALLAATSGLPVRSFADEPQVKRIG